MDIEEKKSNFRYLLRSIFVDECSEIEDNKLTSFYSFLLSDLEERSDFFLSKNDDNYFLIEFIIQVLSNFHVLDSYLLFMLTKSNENFKEQASEQTGIEIAQIGLFLEGVISHFQEIKVDYLAKA